MLRHVLVRLAGFLILFTLLFFLVRNSGFAPLAITGPDITAVASLYSIVGFIFSVVAGFVIQTKWSIWDKLVEASHGEINVFRELDRLSHHWPAEISQKLHAHMHAYLSELVAEAWQDYDRGALLSQAERAWNGIEETVYELAESPKTAKWESIAYDLLSKQTEWREQRFNYSRRHTPVALRSFLIANIAIVTSLSLLLRVTDPFLNYVFTGSIAFLSYSVYILIDDLDHPYRPGGWHLTTEDYTKLLRDISSHRQ